MWCLAVSHLKTVVFSLFLVLRMKGLDGNIISKLWHLITSDQIWNFSVVFNWGICNLLKFQDIQESLTTTQFGFQLLCICVALGLSEVHRLCSPGVSYKVYTFPEIIFEIFYICFILERSFRDFIRFSLAYTVKKFKF